MNQVRLVLALLVVSGALSSNAQQFDGDRQDGVSGGICQAGHHCPPGGPGGGGGGSNVDPSPYDPRPGRPDRPDHHPVPGPQRPDRPDRPDHPGFPDHHPVPGPQRPDRPDYPNNPGLPDYPNQPGYPNDSNQPYPNQPNNPNYPNQPNYPNYPSSDRREIYVSRRVQNEQMDLMQLAGLNSYNDRGTTIESVEVIAQPGAVKSALALNVDGYIVASQNYPSSDNMLYPNRQLVIGQNFNQMSLGVRGVLYIDRIIVNLRSNGYYPQPQPQPQPPYGDLTAPGYVNQTFYSNVTLDVIRITNLQQYRGYHVTAVTVRGRGDSNGSARVVINGVVAGRVDLTYGGTTVNMPINTVVGQNLQSLNLQVVPTTTIDSVEVVLSRY